MGTTSEKLTYLNTTKSELKQAINNLGGNIDSETTFREYVEELQDVYDNYPKTSFQEGTDVTIEGGLKGKLDFENGKVGFGQSSQESTTGKNKLENKATTSTQGGITFTINEDKSVKVNGTLSSASEFFPLNANQPIQPSTEYILNGAGGPSCRLRVREYDSNNNNLSEYFDQSLGVTFTSKSNADHINVQIVVYGNQTNVMVYPMLRLASVADGTYEIYTGGYASPSPNWQQQVKCVAGWNRFYEKENGYISNIDGSISAQSGVSASDYIEIPSGESILYFYGKNLSVSSSLQYANRIAFYDSSKNWISGENKGNIATPTTYSIPNNAKYVRASIVTASEDLMIAFGGVKKYLPYNTIEEVVRGVNIYSGNVELGAINGANGQNESNSSVIRSTTYANVEKIRKIAIVGSDNVSRVKVLATYDKDYHYLGNSTIANNNVFDIDTITISNQTSYYTSNSDIYYVRFVVTGTTDTTISYGIIDNSTTYEPYITPTSYQLSLGEYEFAKIGNYVDTIEYDVDEDKVYKNEYIGKKILKDLEWSKETVGAVPYYYNDSETNFLKLNEGGTNLYCNIYKYGINQEDRAFIGNVHFIGLYSVTAYPDVNNFIQMLTNTNAYLYYMYKTPIKREITGTLKDQIKALYYSHSFTGTTIIESNGDLPMIIKVRGLKGE